ncbi:MAG: SET domain-containing protein-lysine N-methyltransferase [Pedobacter sp.]|nr:SET domain-containing protein-lysine N-methyltransferase [Chitinophagaceae bacterium]
MTTTTTPYQTISQHGFANVLLNIDTNQKSLNAEKIIEAGEVISFFNANETFTHPTYLTVQVGTNKHITLMPEFLQYINHSCNPNVFFDTTSMQLVCLKTIIIGEELGFFYPSTEWEMTQQFVCNCGSANCLQLIQGAAYLSSEVAGQYRFTDFIKQQLLSQK